MNIKQKEPETSKDLVNRFEEAVTTLIIADIISLILT